MPQYNIQELDIKYRPKTLDEVIGQDHIVSIIKGMLYKKVVDRAIMLYGPSGNGKTTIARLIARYINCVGDDFLCGKCITCSTENLNDHPDIIEINAANLTGVDNVRSLVSKAMFIPQTNFNVFILDEAQLLSKSAKECLLKPMEEAEKTIWIICTTEPEKFSNTFTGRCTSLKVNKIKPKILAKYLYNVAVREKSKITIFNDIFMKIAYLVDGQPRNGLKMLSKAIHYVNSSDDGSGKEFNKEILSSIVKDVLNVSDNITAIKYLLSIYNKSLKNSFIVYRDIARLDYFLQLVIEYHTSMIYYIAGIKEYKYLLDNFIISYNKLKNKPDMSKMSKILDCLTDHLFKMKTYTINEKIVMDNLTTKLLMDDI